MSIRIDNSLEKLFFFTSVPTQTIGQKVIIENSDKGLKICVKKENGDIYPVDRHMINGMPKQSFGLKGFFESCYANVRKIQSGDYKVYFFLPIKGGMNTEHGERREFALTRLTNIPSHLGELDEFYARPEVINLKNQLLKNGTYRFGDVIDFMQTGASAINIAYLASTNLGISQGIVGIKYQYSELITKTAESFDEMQTNNIKVIQSHIDANDYLSLNRFNDALGSLRKAQNDANINIGLCRGLKTRAEQILGSLNSQGIMYASHNDQIARDEAQKKDVESQLKEVKINIKRMEEQLLENVRGANETHTKERKARVLDFVTLGIYGLCGYQTDFGIDREKFQEERKMYYQLRQKEKNLELSLIKQMQEISSRLSFNIGNLSSPETARSAIQMALMGVDEVRRGLESYELFMSKVLSYTTVAIDNLERCIQFGGTGLDSSNAKIFIGKFAYSGNYWLGIGALGNVCTKAFSLVHRDVSQRLMLKDPDFNKHLDIAKNELTSLTESLNKREKSQNVRCELENMFTDHPEKAIEQAKNTTPTGASESFEPPEGF